VTILRGVLDPLWSAATRHPFLAALREGTITDSAFDRWLVSHRGIALSHATSPGDTVTLPDEIRNVLPADTAMAWELLAPTIPAAAYLAGGTAIAVHAGDPAVRVFTDRGWRWGGSWRTPIDYQHFERGSSALRAGYPKKPSAPDR
jgi:hypothetical protein